MMTETGQLSDQQEKLVLSSDVTVEELDELISRTDELDFVHHNRLVGVRRHILNILDPEVSETHKKIEQKYLAHLGATAVLEYLPEV